MHERGASRHHDFRIEGLAFDGKLSFGLRRRDGAVQMFWFAWYYQAGYKYRPSFPPNLTHEQVVDDVRLWL